MGDATPRANVLVHETLPLSIFGATVLGAEVFGEAVLGSTPRILDEHGLDGLEWPRTTSMKFDSMRLKWLHMKGEGEREGRGSLPPLPSRPPLRSYPRTRGIWYGYRWVEMGICQGKQKDSSKK